MRDEDAHVFTVEIRIKHASKHCFDDLSGLYCTYSTFSLIVLCHPLGVQTYKQSREAPDLIPISMCPGWVKTDMGGSDALIETDESIPRVTTLLKQLKQTDAGRFFNYRGEELPW